MNRLILESAGQKMSKQNKNYLDPLSVIHKYGVDAFRLYLINSPAVRAGSLSLKKEGMCDILKDVLLPWYSAYCFFIHNILKLQNKEEMEFSYNQNMA